MTETPNTPDDLPRALPDAPRRWRLPLVWILPILVVAAALFVAVREKIAQGTSIEIRFLSADDLEPNQTKVRYKSVEIGEVTDIHVSKDRRQVIVEAKIHRDAKEYLVADTNFWVVRPHVSGGDISGLGTLVSGAYIGVDVGRSTVSQHRFTGLEVPPVVTSGLPGREFILRADDIGSLSIGSTVFYRHIAAGQVVAYALDRDGAAVTMKVFINSPYDTYVTAATHFWQASGIDMSIDSEGVKLHTESLASILQGGVAFQSVGGAAGTAEVAADATFALYSDRERALREPNTAVQTFVMYFGGSLRGLSVGAPVDLRGIDVGEVKKVSVEYDVNAGKLRFPVQMDVFPQRIDRPSGSPADARRLLDSMVAHGVRAEIKSGNLLTGQKYIALDVHPGVPRAELHWDDHPMVFPTATDAVDELEDSVASIAKKINKVPFDKISARLISTLASLDQTLQSTDHLMHHVDETIAPQVSATLAEAQQAMHNAREVLAQGSPLQDDLSNALLQLSHAASSVSALADYLERHPESLLRGKSKDTH